MNELQLVNHPAFCAACHRLEAIPEGVVPFRQCGECGHVYWTADELMGRYHEECNRLDRQTGKEGYSPISRWSDPEAIYFCQECLHDF